MRQRRDLPSKNSGNNGLIDLFKTNALVRRVLARRASGVSEETHRMLTRPYVATLVAASALLNVLLLWVYLTSPALERDVAPHQIRPESGLAFLFTAPRVHFPFGLVDDAHSESGSRLIVLEDGAPLRTPHAPHVDIRTQGHGRYSHWNNDVYFSSSDGTDPRLNGHRYSVIAPLSPASSLVILTATADLLLVWLFRRRLKQVAVAKLIHVIYAVAALLTAFAIAAVSGAFPPQGMPSTDAALVWRAVLHALGGCLFAVLQWAAGAGLAMLLWRRRESDFAGLGLLGVPLGMVITTIAAATVLIAPAAKSIVLALVAACLAGLCLLPYVQYRQQVLNFARAIPPVMLFSTVFGTWIALHWHGPTRTLPGLPSGDLTYYASMLWALERVPYSNAYLPFAGITHNYWNLRLAAVGAAFLRYLPVDGFLFIAGAVPAMGLMGMGLALRAYCSAMQRAAVSLPVVGVIALAFAAAGRYPYWLAESPPVADLAVLTIAVWFYVRRSEMRTSLALPAFALSIIGAALSKVVAGATLGGMTLATLVRASVAARAKLRIAIAVLGLTGVALAAYLLHRFLPFYLATASVGPESLDLLFHWREPVVQAWPFIVRDIATLLLGLLAFRVVKLDMGVVLAMACVATLVDAFVLRANFICTMIVIALVYLESPQALRRTRWHAMFAIGLSMPAMVLTDPSGWTTGLVWTLTVGMICIFAIPLAEQNSRALKRPLWSAWALASALILIGAARGTVDFKNRFVPAGPALTPDVREVWATVRTIAPVGALIFTDQTGEDSKLLGGWNTYVMHGQHQVFVSDVIQDGMLYTHPGAVRDRIRTNASVLDGTTAPSAAAFADKYAGYYAVASTDRRVGPAWQPVRQVGRWVLYVWRDEAPFRSGKPER